MHILEISLFYMLIILCSPSVFAQNPDEYLAQNFSSTIDPDAVALSLIPYLKDDNLDVRLLALADIILTESKLPEISKVEKELLANEPSGLFRDLLELGIQVSSGTSPTGNQTAGDETSELTGSIPEITQGGCYTDTETGEVTCIDSTVAPSNSQQQTQPGMTEVAISGNSALGNSAEIFSSQAVNQAISPAGSSNWYKITAGSNGIFSMKISDVPKDMRPQVRLHDKNFALFEEKIATSAGDDLKFKKDVPTPGEVYIVVWDADGKSHAEPYTLTVDFQPVQDSFDPNNVLGDAAEIQSGQAVTASICPKGELDWYKVKIDSNAILSVSITDVPEDMRSQIKLYDKNFVLFEEKIATSAGDDLKFKRDVPVPGWVYLAIFDADGKAHAEPYTLTVA